MDDAEQGPLSDLLALLLDRRLHGGPTLRLLLLARPLSNWWHALTHRLAEALGIRADREELSPLGLAPPEIQGRHLIHWSGLA